MTFTNSIFGMIFGLKSQLHALECLIMGTFLIFICVCDVLTNGKWDLNRLKMMIPRDVRAKIKTIVPCLHSSLPNIVYLKLGIASWNWVWKASVLENIIFFMWLIFSRGLTHKTTPSS